MKKYLLLLSLSVAAPAWAQDAPRPDAGTDPKDVILVTATRTAARLDSVAASVTVLDKEAIDRAQDIGITELLIRTPGVTFSRNGGYGTATQLRVRGAETDQTVVVIDGVKLNDPAAAGGGYNFANLLIGDTARIEVLRGPQSILWGSQAIGGVVNIVTAEPEAGLQGSFDAEAGSRDTVSGRIAVGGRTGPLSFRLGVQSFTTDGISAIARSAGGVETDGYTNRGVQGRAKLELAQGVSAEVRGYYSSGKVQQDAFNGDSADYSLNREFVGYAGLNVDLFDGRLRNRFAYGRTSTDRDNFNPTRARQLSFDASGKNRRFEYQGNLTITDAIGAVFGIENERSRFSSVSPPAALTAPVPAAAQGRATLTGIYGQLSAEVLTGLTLTGGVRRDDHSRFGTKTLFAAGGAWRLPTNTILRASYGEGFKAPTLFQLFSEFGNRALEPEEADGWEAGVEQRLLGDAVSIGGTYFRRDTTNQVIFSSCTTTSTNPLCFIPGTATRRSGFYQNVAVTYAQGIEAVAQARVGTRLLIDGNYSWLESEDRSPGANFGRWLPRRPRHAANASFSYAIPEGPTLGAAVRWSGKSFDNATNTTRLAPYTLVDLRGELPVSDEVGLFARVENVFDKEYQTIARYGTLGRSIYAGLRGRF